MLRGSDRYRAGGLALLLAISLVAAPALYAAIATLAVAPLALGDRGWYQRVLSSRPMVWGASGADSRTARASAMSSPLR